jgi:hypothetical protein
MQQHPLHIPSFTNDDLDLVLREAAPKAQDPEQLKTFIREDAQFRKALLADERVFNRLTSVDGELLGVSPALYFEVLLRKAALDLTQAGHTVERTGRETVVVFDTVEVVDLLGHQGMVEYMAQMLASFSRINSFTVRVRVKPHVWRRQRYNDMDIDSLVRMYEHVEEEQRFGLLKRLGDLCLFILGVFPEHAASAAAGTRASRLRRRGTADYITEGKRFYKAAAEHPGAAIAGMAASLETLHRQFVTATKPLAFIADHYMRQRKQRLFPWERPEADGIGA